MIGFSQIGALILIIVAILAISLFRIGLKKPSFLKFRPIQSINQLKRSIGLSVEQGSRAHISLGNSDPTSPTFAAGIAALSTLEQIARASSLSDRPPMATSGNGTLAILSQDTIHSIHQSNNSLELYDFHRGLLTGPTPMSYIAGTLPIIKENKFSTNVFVGNFGSEAALMVDTTENQAGFTIAGSDSLTGQAAFFATSQHPLIGEELFALPAYLSANPVDKASLPAQDLLRWIVIIAILVGSILKFIGIL